MNRTAADRGWVCAAAVVIVAAAVARIHNAFVFPPLQDFDGAGHAINTFALFEGRLPSRASWSGFHPPLAYAAGAALWRVLPESVPVHAALRLLSAAAGFGALTIAWRTLRRFVGPADAAVSAALVAGAPVFAIATSMLGNEMICVLFSTAALARLAAAPAPGAPGSSRHLLVTMSLAALAGLAKSTGLGVVAIVALHAAWRLRAVPSQATRAVALAALPALALLGPYYGLLIAETGSPMAAVSGGAISPDARAEMATQPPGERHLSDYMTVPAATLLAPFKDAAGMVRSVPGLLYATTWADGHGEFLPPTVPRVVAAAALLSIGGLLPTGLALFGVAVAWRRRREMGAAAPLFAFAALLLAAFLAQTWALPVFSAVKASYLLSALLPFALLLALGLSAAGPRTRRALRAALLLYSAAAIAVTWWGWWNEKDPTPPPAAVRRLATPGSAAAVVEAYFHALGRDPLRTLPLVTPHFHRQHGLRLATNAEVTRHLRGEAWISSVDREQPVPVERNIVAWLAIQKREAFRSIASRLVVMPVADTLTGDRASLTVQIRPPGGIPLEQRFTLVRGGDTERWRIDEVEQHDVVAGNGPAAFVAWPNEATRAWLDGSGRAKP